MKNLIVFIIIILFTSVTQGQRQVEEEFKVSEAKQINFNFKFASDIKVMQWEKEKININATVLVDNGDGNNAYSLKSEESFAAITIYSDFGDYFKQKDNIIFNNCTHKTEINYVVYVPKNCSLKIKSITGDVISENFSGKMEADLISGNVDLKKYQGELALKSISGNLDVTMKKAEIDAKTLTGTIYSNLDIEKIKTHKKSSLASRIQGIVSNGSEKAKLETISGNIYLRKQ